MSYIGDVFLVACLILLWLPTLICLGSCNHNHLPYFVWSKNFEHSLPNSGNSGKWPTWCTISSIICLFESSTCFEQLRAHPQKDNCINPLNPDLNPICYLLALLAYHFLHVSRIRVKSWTLRLLMSYIYMTFYIYIYIWH